MEEHTSRTTRWKWVRTLALRALLGLAAFAGVLVALGWWFEDDIKAWFLARLNEELNVRVAIDDVDFSLLRDFPNASIRLEEVQADHSRPYKGAGKLLQAESVDFAFSILDLLSERYEIKSIELRNATVQILRNAQGVVNYDILKPRKTQTKEGKMDFRLDLLRMHRVKLIIRDQPSDFQSVLFVPQMKASGNFSDTKYQLQLEGNLQAELLQTQQTVWLKERPVELDMELEVDQSQKRYLFRKGDVRISELELSVAGIYRNTANPYFDIEAQGEAMDIESVLSLLPPGYDDKIAEYQSQGEMYARLRMKGNWSNSVKPAIRVDFGCKDAEIENKKQDVKLEHVHLTGQYENVRGGVLHLKQVQLELNGGSLKGDFHMEQFNDPKLEFQAQARLNLADVNRFVSIEPVRNLSGNAEMNLRMSTALHHLNTFDEGGYENMLAEGYLRIENAAFRIAGDSLNYRDFSGNLQFARNQVHVDNMQGKMGNTDFRLKGSLSNLFGWLFGEQQAIGIKASVESRLVDLDELFSRKTKSAGADETYAFRISPRLQLEVQARVQQVNFRRFAASSVMGRIEVANATLKAPVLRFKTMKGSVEMQGSVSAAPDGRLLLSCTSHMRQVDINRLFYEFENFGQQVLQDKNIRGRVDADIDFEAVASSALEINPALIYSKAALTIREGELIQFEPLEALSKFVAVDELKHVRFSTLQNTIEIRNRKIIIPHMDISSSALSISASGVHDFDNQIEYHLRLLLSDLLAKKARKARREVEEFGEIEDDGLGRTRLFIAMTGPISDPKITYDSKGAKEKIQQDIKQEKQTVKKLLREEFGLFRKDSTLGRKVTPPKKSSKIILDFEDE
jgi:uncharacterized protein involved in outer membrane biogenesis